MRRPFRFTLKNHPSLKLISGLAASNLLGMAIGIIGGLVQARYVSPDDLGYFKSFSIATGYAFVLNLGLFGAVQRLYPYYIGKGERGKAVALVEIAQAWNVLITIIVSVIFLILAIYKIIGGNWKGMLGWIAQIVALSGFVYGGFLNATFRSGQEFKALSRATVISSSASLVILPFFPFMPYLTLGIKSMLGPIINLVYLHKRRPFKVGWRFNFKEFFELVKMGFPIFISGYGATTLWSVIETSIVLKLYGSHSLGLWALSFMISEAAIKIPQAITMVFSPRIMETFGRTNDVGAVIRLIKKPLLFGIPAMLVVALVSCGALKYLVPVIMPQYTEALPLMYLFLLLLPLALMDMPFQILIAKGRGVDQSVSVFTGMIIFVLLCGFFYKIEYGLTGIILASLFGRLVSRFITYYYVYQYHKFKDNVISE